MVRDLWAVLVASVVCLSVAGEATGQPAPADGRVLPGRIQTGIAGAWAPPSCTGVFTDVACPGYWAVNWIEQLRRDAVTTGCNPPTLDQFCPEQTVTRAQMAVFLERAMRGTADWPPHTVLVWAVKNPDGTPNPTASGAALVAGIAGIPTSGADAPSGSNPWAVRIGPGTYSLGSTPLVVPPFTVVAGADRRATIISGNGFQSLAAGTVMPGLASTLRDLDVRNVGGNAYATAVYLSGTGSVVIESVDIVAVGGTVANYGVHQTGSNCELRRSQVMAFPTDLTATYGIASHGSTVSLIDSAVIAGHAANLTAWAVFNDGSNAYLTNSSASADYALWNTGSTTTVNVDHCTLQGVAGASIHNASAYTLNMTLSRLDGPIGNPGAGTFHCFGNYSGTYAAVACP